ncbi:AraC family transcriptional regulator [Alteromonas sp. KUL49]|uniref:AraC family transcriptional regulator n=1 Tax=Alteromonas sp. KUL49 TaxID=2480798 RepID=UPI0013EEC0C3|nr:AraC family transcriptional regulator [Alteromonas sp. KUL49]
MLTTSKAYFSSVLQYLEQHGVSPEDALCMLKEDFSDLNNADVRVSLESYEKLLCLGESLLSDRLFGFHLGQDIRTADFGVLGYLVESCSTLEAALKVLLRFDSLVADIAVASVLHNEHYVEIRWTPKTQTNKHVILRNMTAWVAITRKIVRSDIAPSKMNLTVALSGHERSLLEQWFGCEVCTKQQYNALIFPTAFLYLSFDSKNPDLYSTLTNLSESQLTALASSHPYQDKLSHLLEQTPNLGEVSLDTYAIAFTLSPRTLQRRLQAEGTTFVRMLDKERKKRAQRLIVNTSLSELSNLLGFNDQSAFNKAFRRWFDQTPSTFKKSMDRC